MPKKPKKKGIVNSTNTNLHKKFINVSKGNKKKKTCVKHTIEWPQNLQLQPTLKSKAHSYKLSLETRDDNKRRK